MATVIRPTVNIRIKGAESYDEACRRAMREAGYDTTNGVRAKDKARILRTRCDGRVYRFTIIRRTRAIV